MVNGISKIIKEGLKHTIAQAFLLFSGVLVIVSVWAAKDYIFVSFFTLFYALINFKMEALRRHETLGRYAVGNDHGQNILFTVTSIFHFMWWAIGVGIILLSLCDFVNKSVNCFAVTIDFFCALFLISIIIFLAAFIMTMIWLWRMFYNKRKVEKDYKGDYETKYSCKNCDFEGKVKIPQKRPFHDQPCPQCGLYELKW